MLDCHAITQVRYADLIGMSPSDFALPDGRSTAVISASEGSKDPMTRSGGAHGDWTSI